MSTWYIQEGDLVRAGWGQKYIDKVRTAAGNWRYIYEEDIKPKAQQAASTAKQAAQNAYNTGKEAAHNAVDRYKTQQNAKRIKENAESNRARSNFDLAHEKRRQELNKNVDLRNAENWKKADASKRFQQHVASKASQEKDERVLAGKKRYAEAAATAKKYAGQQKAAAGKSSRHNASDFSADTKGRAEYRQTTAKQNKSRSDFDADFDSRSGGMLKTAKRNASRIRNAAAANRAEQEAAVRQVGIAEAKKNKRQRNSESTQKLLKQAARNAEKVRNGALVSEAVAKNKKAASDARLASENKERLRASGESGTRNRTRARKAQEYNRNVEASRRAVEKNQRTARYNEGQKKKEEQKRYNASATRRERRLG